MRELIIRINRSLSELCGYLLLLVMLMVSADVLLRNTGVVVFGVVESAMYIVVAVVFLGLGHTEEKDGHVRITVLLARLSPPWRFALRALMALCTLAVMTLAAWACFESAVGSYADNEAVMASHVPLYTWPARSAVFVGILFYCFQLIVSLSDEFAKFKTSLADSTKGDAA